MFLHDGRAFHHHERTRPDPGLHPGSLDLLRDGRQSVGEPEPRLPGAERVGPAVVQEERVDRHRMPGERPQVFVDVVLRQ